MVVVVLIFFQKAGFNVTLFEKNTICSGGSYPAGAFLSPELSKPSKYKDYLNSALKFSLNFYKTFFPLLLKEFHYTNTQKIKMIGKNYKVMKNI